MGPATTLTRVAIRASREIVIDASPEAIIDAVADVQSLPSWSPVHKNVQFVDAYPDGRPHHVKVTVNLMGITDEEVLEYHWGRNWVVWDAIATPRQHDQHVEFTMRPDAGKTRLRIDITLEPGTLLPDFVLRRPRENVLATVAEALRRHVMARAGADVADTRQNDSG